MNHKLLKASIAGAAVIALAAGGSTYAALSDFGNITGNSVGAGFLKLQLNAGTGSQPLDFKSLAPNMNANQTVWVASNSGDSVPNANISLTFQHLVDTAAPCSTSLGKATADPGCTVTEPGDVIGGTPTEGHLSQMLSFRAAYYPSITDPQTCQTTAPFHAPLNDILAGYPGNMNVAATAGTPFQLKDLSGNPLVLQPGQGVCILIQASWPYSAAHPDYPHFTNSAYPVDNAAQGDSMKFDARFDLTQAF